MQINIALGWTLQINDFIEVKTWRDGKYLLLKKMINHGSSLEISLSNKLEISKLG